MLRAKYDVVKPISVALRDTLLVKCSHGNTQNATKVLNNLIRTKCLKNIFLLKQYKFRKKLKRTRH